MSTLSKTKFQVYNFIFFIKIMALSKKYYKRKNKSLSDHNLVN